MIIEIKNYRAHSRNKTEKKHWRKYMNYRDELSLLIRANSKKKVFTSPVRVDICAYYKGKRHVDTSNIDDKMILDGLQHAGIIEDDRAYENPLITKMCIPEYGENKLVILVEDLQNKQGSYSDWRTK